MKIKSFIWQLVIASLLVFALIRYWANGETLLISFYTALSPFTLGIGVAYIVNILMTKYETLYHKLFPKSKGKVGRILSLILAYLTFIFAVVFLISLVIPDLISSLSIILSGLPAAITRLVADIQQNDWIMTNVPFSDIAQQLNAYSEQIVSYGGSALTGVLSSLTGVFKSLFDFFIAFIFSLYLLLGKESLIRQANKILKAYFPKFQAKILHISQVFHRSFTNFFIGQTLEAIILGSLTFVGMLIFRMPYASTISIVIGFTALIPVVGAYLGLAVGFILIATQSLPLAFGFIVFLVILQQIEGNLIYPRVVGNSVGLPGMWVIVAVTLGGALGGILGLLAGVPVAASLYQLFSEDVNSRL